MKSINKDGTVGFMDKTDTSTGTSLMGYVTVSYDKLVEVFGKETSIGDEYKTDAHWLIMTLDGIATIYNYKDGKSYLGDEGLAKEDITNWHIGGGRREVVYWIHKALGISPESEVKAATAVINPNKPRFQHPCTMCVFLGTSVIGKPDGVPEVHDMYFHRGHAEVTVIARYSNNGPDYHSGLGIIVRPLLHATVIAVMKGLLKPEELRQFFKI